MRNNNQIQNEDCDDSKLLSKIPKRKEKSLLDKLIVTIVIGTLTYVGITFLNCNFLVFGSMERAHALGGLKNPPPLKCEQSISQGYSALFTLLTAILGLKAKMED